MRFRSGAATSLAAGQGGFKVRIAHVITRLLRAGSEENTLLTAAGQIAKGHDVFILHGRDSVPAPSRLLSGQADFVEIPAMVREISPSLDTKAILQTRRVFREIQPDVVHTHQSKAGIVGRLAAASSGVPLVIHGVHILPFQGVTGIRRSIYLQSERLAARYTHGFIHVSEAMKRGCLDNGVGANRPHFIVRSGFDLERFANAQAPDGWRDILNLKPGEPKPPVVTVLASLEPRKQHIRLLGLVPSILARVPDLRFVFAGEGALQDEIEAKVASLGLTNNVLVLGYREDPERIIATADIGLLCSTNEGLPRSILQYLAVGRPALSFDLPGLDLVLKHDLNGLVAPPSDWTALGELLVDAVKNPERMARLKTNAAKTDLSQWHGDLMGENVLEAYRVSRNYWMQKRSKAAA